MNSLVSYNQISIVVWFFPISNRIETADKTPAVSHCLPDPRLRLEQLPCSLPGIPTGYLGSTRLRPAPDTGLPHPERLPSPWSPSHRPSPAQGCAPPPTRCCQ